jgi:hypothetical protein
LPAVNYAARDIIYRPRNVRAHKVYGYSPVQQVLMTVNIALRRQIWQLDYYSEGSVPDALIGVPNSWTPDQIRQFQDYWDTEFSGDLAKRRRAKFVPGDTASKVHQTKEPEQKNEFDEWLARIICFAFSIPPQWAVKAMNRATADNQSAQSEEEGLQPTKEWVKDLIDAIIADEFASPDLELHWLDEDDSDAGKSEATFEARLKIGAVTLNEVRSHLGLDPYTNPAADRPMVLTATGYVPIEANAGGGGEQEESGTDGQPSGPSGKDTGRVAARANAQSAIAVQKYNPDQPRVPAGNRDGGQWANGNESGAATVHSPATGATQYTALETKTQTDAPNEGLSISAEPPPKGPSNGNGPKDRYAAITIQRYDRTGNPDVDRNTDILFQTFARYVEIVDRAGILLGKFGPALFGTLVHAGFAADVRSQQLPGIGREGVEQSFSFRDVIDYGADGSIRTDVVMRNSDGDVIAIWDLKTGKAKLTDARIREIRREVGVSDDVPVIEVHISRGVTSKLRNAKIATGQFTVGLQVIVHHPGIPGLEAIR